MRCFLSRIVRFLGLSLLTIALLFGCNAQSVNHSPGSGSNQPLVVGSSPWPGFAGHYVAVAKDLFKAEGISVNDSYFQVATDVNTALLAGKLDLAWTGVPDLVVMASKDPSLRLLMLSDYSNGADGILARNVNSPADLKGKEVAWEGLPLQAVLLRKYLQQGGLSEKDVKLRVITAAEAASAFGAKRLDVAVTYEPWLTTAAQQGQGKVIFSSRNTNIIPVGLVAKTSVIESRKAEIQAFMKAIDQAVRQVRENPKQTAPIIAQKLGVKPEEVQAQLDTVRIFDLNENKSIVFNPSEPLNVIDSLKFDVETSQAIGLIPNRLDEKNLYDDSLVKGL